MSNLFPFSDLARKDLPDVSDLVVRPVDVLAFRCDKTLTWSGRTDIKNSPVNRFETFFARACLQVWVVGGVNIVANSIPLYAEINFASELNDPISKQFEQLTKSSFDKDAETAFWQLVLSKTRYSELRPFLLGEDNIPELEKRRVFVPSELAHPMGHFFDQLMQRPERTKAFFIACYGIRNPRLCTHCIHTYTRTVASCGEHILYPFHECISFSGVLGGTCANCAWSARPDCNWKEFSGYLPTKEDHCSAINPFLGSQSNRVPASADVMADEYLSDKNAPRLAIWPQDDKKNAEKELEAGAKGFCYDLVEGVFDSKK